MKNIQRTRMIQLGFVIYYQEPLQQNPNSLKLFLPIVIHLANFFQNAPQNYSNQIILETKFVLFNLEYLPNILNRELGICSLCLQTLYSLLLFHFLITEWLLLYLVRIHLFPINSSIQSTNYWS